REERGTRTITFLQPNDCRPLAVYPSPRLTFRQDSAARTGRAVPDRPSLDRLRRLVPRDCRPPEVRLVGHVTGERGVVAEHHILDHRLPGAHRLEEVPQVRPCEVTVGTRERYRLREGDRHARFGIVLPVPLLLVCVAQGARVAP